MNSHAELQAIIALRYLRDALVAAKAAGAIKTAARIRHAISSAKGAVRAAGYRRNRAQEART